MKWAAHTFLLKIKLGGEYVTLGGQRDTNRSRQIRLIDASDKGSSWRQLLEGGVRQEEIRARGLVQDAAAHKVLAQLAADGSFNEFQLVYGDGAVVEGSFQVSAWSGNSEYRAAQQYELTLSLAGDPADEALLLIESGDPVLLVEGGDAVLLVEE